MATVYKVKTVAVDGTVHVRWTTSESAARKTKRALAEAYGLKPIKEVSYETVVLPSGKIALVDWLNEHHRVEPA